MSVFFTRRGKAADYTPDLLDNFADNSWENIIWACQTGNVPDTWTVASQKNMTINGTDYAIDIIGLNHDDYADGSGKAPITFQMHDCCCEEKLKETASNSGGWGNSYMRTTVVQNLLGQLPPGVQTAVREVNKLTSAGGKKSTINTTSDKLFLLSYVEVVGSSNIGTSSFDGEGSQYAYYAEGNSKEKASPTASSYPWWTRSPYKSNNTAFVVVAGESTAYIQANNSFGVAFAFCF